MDAREFYSRAWDILVEAGQIRDLRSREAFVRYFAADRGTEWRFGGDLGFGGKFWHNAERHYVACYPEDRTPERDELIQEINAKLDILRES